MPSVTRSVGGGVPLRASGAAHATAGAGSSDQRRVGRARRGRAAAPPAEQRPPDAGGREGVDLAGGRRVEELRRPRAGTAGRRSGSSTRSMTSRKAISSGGKRMTLRATTATSSSGVAAGATRCRDRLPMMTRPVRRQPGRLRSTACPARAVTPVGARARARPTPARRGSAGPRAAARTGASPFDPDETPLSRTRRARRMARELALIHPDAHCELDFTNAVRAARRHGPLGADHRQDGQQGDADAVRPLPRRRRPRRRRPRRSWRRSSSRPASSGPRRTRCSASARRWSSGSTARCPAGWPTWSRCPASGRKTANVVLGNAFGVPGLTVDTHFGRLVRRFGWTAEERPGQGRGRDRRAGPEEGVDRLQPPRDLPRPAGLPRQEGGLRRLRAGAVVPVVRHRPGRPRGRPLKLVKSPAASDTE